MTPSLTLRAGAAVPPPSADDRTDAAADAPLDVLLARVSTGDRRAFRRLYDITSRCLLGVAHGLLRDRDLAEDVLQDAFLKVWQRAGSFEAATARPMTWLISIVRNRAIDVLRARRAESESALPFDDDLLQLAADASSRPDVAWEERRTAAQVAQGLARLTAAQRQALTLAYHGGLTHAEIAATMGAPLGTAKAWVRRGLESLKARLD
jgi:RNA polymerase sigma-70 factor, ECF subfamily